jgi:hypothetical protein
MQEPLPPWGVSPPRHSYSVSKYLDRGVGCSDAPSRQAAVPPWRSTPACRFPWSLLAAVFRERNGATENGISATWMSLLSHWRIGASGLISFRVSQAHEGISIGYRLCWLNVRALHVKEAQRLSLPGCSPMPPPARSRLSLARWCQPPQHNIRFGHPRARFEAGWTTLHHHRSAKRLIDCHDHRLCSYALELSADSYWLIYSASAPTSRPTLTPPAKTAPR